MRIVAIENADPTEPPCGRPATVKLAEVFLTERALLRKIVAGLGLPAGDADDVLQTVSLKCLNHATPFADRDACRRWLIRVTTNECITEHRRIRRFGHHAGKIAERRRRPETHSPVESVISAEQLEVVQQALRGLDDALLRPLVLRYFCGLTSAEIGQILDMPAPTVRSVLCKARMALANALIRRGIDE